MRVKLKEARIKNKLTHQEIADLVGIDRSYYTNIELGNKNPSFKVVMEIKKILKTNDDNVFSNYKCQKGTNTIETTHKAS